MKSSIVKAVLLAGVLAVRLQAECAYFRVSADLEKCQSVDPKVVKDTDTYTMSEIPELEETRVQAYIQVKCDCGYSLMGSDPRCDTDQSFERTSVLGADDLAHACRRGTALCREVCPPRLP